MFRLTGHLASKVIRPFPKMASIDFPIPFPFPWPFPPPSSPQRSSPRPSPRPSPMPSPRPSPMPSPLPAPLPAPPILTTTNGNDFGAMHSTDAESVLAAQCQYQQQFGPTVINSVDKKEKEVPIPKTDSDHNKTIVYESYDEWFDRRLNDKTDDIFLL